MQTQKLWRTVSPTDNILSLSNYESGSFLVWWNQLINMESKTTGSAFKWAAARGGGAGKLWTPVLTGHTLLRAGNKYICCNPARSIFVWKPGYVFQIRYLLVLRNIAFYDYYESPMLYGNSGVWPQGSNFYKCWMFPTEKNWGKKDCSFISLCLCTTWRKLLIWLAVFPLIWL